MREQFEDFVAAAERQIRGNVLPEKLLTLTAAALAGQLRQLLADRPHLLAMARAARGTAWLQAERKIADAVLAEASA